MMVNVEEILKSKKNFISFLNEKGFEINKKYKDNSYPDAAFLDLGQHRLLALQQCDNDEESKAIKNHFLMERGLSHCAIFMENKIIFCRSYGERKHFIFSIRNKTNVSKRNKINRINEDIDILFQSKDISKQFYDEFKKRRDFLVQKMEGKFEPERNFLLAQKIFDRIFFIYFLCHKNIVRFQNGDEVSGNVLFQILNDSGDLYLNLFKLFQKFNSEDGGTLKIDEQEFFVPYLNGGIFRIDEDENKMAINLTKDEWNEIFNFLNGYHWIIEDDVQRLVDEDSDEKILTPEILGHIYERSVVEWELKGFKQQAEESAGIVTSERKKKGVYYTPEDITEFICLNSLYDSLANKLNTIPNKIPEIIESSTEIQYKEILNILDTIRIIDPACGSGAFLVKMSDILFRMKVKVLSELKQSRRYYDIKKEIITSNIFGVDILQGAAEIAKLRLWLWLVASYSEQKEIQPLPNIEYNVVVGNSLVGLIDEKTYQILDIPFTSEISWIFEAIKVHSSKTNRKIYERAEELLQTKDLENYIDAYSLLHDVYKNSHGDSAFSLKKILIKIKQIIYKSISQSLVYKVNENLPKRKKIRIEQFESLSPLHWRFDFGDIIKKGGFDVVIGNPPYGNTLNDLEKAIVNELYDYNVIKTDCLGRGSNNSSAIFLERVFQFLRKDGMLGFIVPSSIARTQEFSKIRNLLKTYNLKKLSEVGKAFEEVGLEMIILIIQKSKNKEKFIILSQYDGRFHDREILSSIYDSRDIFLTMIDNEKYQIIQKLEENSKKLSSLGVMPRGFTVSSTKYHERPTKDSVLVLGGANLFRYGLKDGPKRKPNRYLNIDNEELRFDIFEKKRIIYQNVASSLPRIIATIDYSSRPTDDTINNLILNDNKLLKSILLVLNSNLSTFYLKYAIINCSTLTVHLDEPYVGQIPIKMNIKIDTFEKICNCLLFLNCQFYFLNKNGDDVSDLIKLISFYRKIANYVVYESFLPDQLSNNLTNYLQKLETIDFDEISCNKNGNELSIKIPTYILDKILEIYNKLNKDPSFKQIFEKLSQNKWVKIFDAENSDFLN